MVFAGILCVYYGKGLPVDRFLKVRGLISSECGFCPADVVGFKLCCWSASIAVINISRGTMLKTG